MLSWKIADNVISQLQFRGSNIINPWGFETADSSAFFSLEEGIGWRSKTLEQRYDYDEHRYRADLTVQMKEGRWALRVEDEIAGDCVDRRVEALTLEESVFMDFVLRFRFKKAMIEYAEIAGKQYRHEGTNIYRQYPVDEVFLKGKGFDITLSILDREVPESMQPVMYVRDYKDEWVVHARMIPRRADKEVIKICTAWAGTRPLPQWISRPLLAWKTLKEALWYRGERQPFKNRFVRRFLNPAAFAMVRVPKNSRLMWHVRMRIR